MSAGKMVLTFKESLKRFIYPLRQVARLNQVSVCYQSLSVFVMNQPVFYIDKQTDPSDSCPIDQCWEYSGEYSWRCAKPKWEDRPYTGTLDHLLRIWETSLQVCECLDESKHPSCLSTPPSDCATAFDALSWVNACGTTNLECADSVVSDSKWAWSNHLAILCQNDGKPAWGYRCGTSSIAFS